MNGTANHMECRMLVWGRAWKKEVGNIILDGSIIHYEYLAYSGYVIYTKILKMYLLAIYDAGRLQVSYRRD